ncbi:hypothetical protein B0H14DRAFT_3709150 [Mycena olivaceomarginata]|nr:hypothetical protein B0H14DRAFT_3709150 [Mycena olivaceomarginata]
MANTSRTIYALRARKDGKVIKPAVDQQASEISDSDSDTRQYSDVVAARSSVLSSVPREVVSADGSPSDVRKQSPEPAMPASPAVEMVEDENPNPWQTVDRKSRRRASLESLNTLRKAGKKVEFLPQRSPVEKAEQDTAIQAAERQLTDAEKETIRKRTLATRVKIETESSESIKSVSEASIVSPAIPSGEGTSQSKGKGF